MKCRIVFLLTLLFSLGGCAAFKRHPAPPPPLEHQISIPGETLGAIAAWYTGTAQNWRAIAEINPGVNPNRLRFGQVVLIPRSLVTRETPLPKKFLEGFAGKSKPAEVDPSVAEPPAPSSDQKEVPLYGEQPVTPDTDPDPVGPEVAITPSGEISPPAMVTPGQNSNLPATLATAAPTPGEAAEGKRQKTRDELLKELLEGY